MTSLHYCHIMALTQAPREPTVDCLLYINVLLPKQVLTNLNACQHDLVCSISARWMCSQM